MIQNLIKAFLVDSALSVWRFAKRHPMITLAILLFFVLIPFLVQTYGFARAAMGAIAKVVNWFSGREADGTILPTYKRLVRYGALIAIAVLIPGSWFLFMLGKLSLFIWSERELKRTEGKTSFQPSSGGFGSD